MRDIREERKERIASQATYSAKQVQKQLQKGEAAPEEMPDEFVGLEKDLLAEVLGGFTEDEWQFYREAWEEEMEKFNQRRTNIS